MKKLLGSVLALAFIFVSSQASAELLKNFKFGGSVEMNAVSARNVTTFDKTTVNAVDRRQQQTGVATDRLGTAQTRIMLNLDWDLLDDVHSKVTLTKNNRVYGAAGAGHSGSESLDNLQTNIFIDQGYFKIDKVFGLMDATFGRQFFGEPGDLIAYFGPVYGEYGMQVRAIDGARFDWAGEKAYASVVMFEPFSNADVLNSVALINKKDIRGIIVGNKGDEHIDAKLYVYNVVTHGVANPVEARNDNLYIPGFKVKAKFGGLYASIETAFNMGENRTYNNYGTGATPTDLRYAGVAYLADVGMKAEVEQIGTFNPWAQWGYGSGADPVGANTPMNGNAANGMNLRQTNRDFQAVMTDYRPGAIYGRFDGANAGGYVLGTGGAMAGGIAVNANGGNGLQNRIIWGLGVKATPSALNKLTAGVAFYDFNWQNLGPGTGAEAGNRHIGSEVDVTAEWKHSENVSIKGTLGDFLPGGFIKNQVNGVNGAPATGLHPSAALMSALDVTVKF